MSIKHRKARGRMVALVATVLMLCTLAVSGLRGAAAAVGFAGAQDASARQTQTPDERLKRTGVRQRATADLDLLGLAVSAGPANQSVPKNTATVVQTALRTPEGIDAAQLIPLLNPNFRVRGLLTGPSLNAPLTVEARIGEPLPIPPLPRAGDHLLRDLRVVDIGQDGSPAVVSVTPDACGINIIERLLVSEVRVRELTYDEIVQAGINLTDDSYKAFNFTLGLATTSEAKSISIPVAFPPVGAVDPRPVVGIPQIQGPGIEVPTVLPVMLTAGSDVPSGGPPNGGGSSGGLMMEDGPVRIPGVVIFPGNVGFLNQFFEAVVIVANGAPDGTPLVLRDVSAMMVLPDGGTPDNPTDDPLRIAETRTGGRVDKLELHGLGADNKYGTEDDLPRFAPGQSGQATFLIEGRKEGLHSADFLLKATVEGLTLGPLEVSGKVSGAVLVRDASFAVTFTHPSVVRAGQEYDLGMTVSNTGSRDIQGAFANLAGNSISGARLLADDDGRRQFRGTIKTGEAATVKWRLRSDVTGKVTASYLKVGEGITAGLNLTVGVGDRNVPLSPDSLILPEQTRFLPESVVESARQMLGQAWSVASAPPGSLPSGVTPIAKQTVVDRAVELGVAGLRVDFGEPVSVSLDTFLRDWLGEPEGLPDAGFADALRNTPSGYAFMDGFGAAVYKQLAGPPSVSPAQFQQELADAESARSPFISALVTQPDGAPIVGARLRDSRGGRVGFGASVRERSGDLASGASLRLDRINPLDGESASTLGQMLLVSNPDLDEWTLELNALGTGTVDISLLVPATTRTYRQFSWATFNVTQGEQYRVVFSPLSATDTPSLEVLKDGEWRAAGATPITTTLNQPAPRIVGVTQVTPEVLEGGDKYGRLVGVLFSKPMAQASAETAARYRLGGGTLKNSDPPEQVVGTIKIRAARLDYDDRFAFLSLDSTIGPYVQRDLTISGVSDARRMQLAPSPSTRAVETRVSSQGKPPGAFATGRVLRADGTPVANCAVVYYTQECPDPSKVALPPPPIPIAARFTDSQGRYAFDYLRDGDCAPVSVVTTNPQNFSEKKLNTPVAYDGQHMVLDFVFLGRGNVRGTLTSGGRVVPRAFVKVVPELDINGTKVVQSDDEGRYVVNDVPVGNFSVIVVGADEFANASGLGAGTVYEPGQTAIVDVSLQNIAGVVRGRVVKADRTAASGTAVVAYAKLSGFPAFNDKGLTAVGFVNADRDGIFQISNLPVQPVRLEVIDYVSGLVSAQEVVLTAAAPEASGVLLVLPLGGAAGGGTLTGRVKDDIGRSVPGAMVFGAGRVVRADAQGDYTLRGLPAGMLAIAATDPNDGASGSVTAEVLLDETVGNVDITILRPAMLRGTVYVQEQGAATPRPLAGVQVTANGLDIVTTDGQGRYSIPNVVPNRGLTLRFVETARQFVINTDVRLRPGETQNQDATFRPGSIRGKVFQPDGRTGTIAQLQLYVPRPTLDPGAFFGLVDEQKAFPTESGPDGSYSFSGLNPGRYRVTAANVFFPTVVANGGTLPPGGSEQCDLSLVDTLAGKIQGRVFQPDGVTPVGGGVRVTIGGGSLGDATVRTDAEGHYEFGMVFSAGTYMLTANDPASGRSNRVRISVERNMDAMADIRLLGTGSLRVKVVDGAGAPARTGSVTIDGTEFPNERRFVELVPGDNGVVEFERLPEGMYAVAAVQQGLGGRASATVPLSATAEVTVQLQSSGTVRGRVLLPGGVVPSGLADVELRLGGRPVGYTVTADDEAGRGSFTFLNVPSGDFTLEVFDNRTGRAGRSAGRLVEQGEVATVNVELLPVGAVKGRVTSNGQPVDHALVRISADGSGVRGADASATTDADGRFRFTGIPAGKFRVEVTNAPGGQTGSTTGMLAGNTEPLPDMTADVTLEPSINVAGRVFETSGVPSGGARVTAFVNGRRLETTTRDDGTYTLRFVPLGEVRLRAEAATGYDRGEAAPLAATQPGATLNADITLAGTGTVAGDALDNNGSPLSAGIVKFVNDAWEPPLVLRAAVRPGGRFEFAGVPAGRFSLQLTTTNRTGVGAAAGELANGQTLEVPVRLEDAGRVTARVRTEDGTANVVGADVTLTLLRANGQTLRLFANTDAQGMLLFDYVPLGTASLVVNDPLMGGVAAADGLALTSNGQTLDLGELRVDSTPIRVESVSPAAGTNGVNVSSPVITLTFSEPARRSTVNANSIRLVREGVAVNASLSLSADGRTATLTPAERLADVTEYQIVVTNALQDAAGLAPAAEFRSSFRTFDATAPSVTAIVPADGADGIALTPDINVTFDEPLDPAQDLSTLVALAPSGPNSVAVAGTAALDAAARTVTFRPAASLLEGTRYTVAVKGQRDASGNTQNSVRTSSFATRDQSPPFIEPLPLDGQRVRTFTPVITATFRDNYSGVRAASVVLLLDGSDVTAGAVVTGSDLSFRPARPLTRGRHTVSVTAADNAGNVSQPRTAAFEIDDTGPVITSFTVGGVPAADDISVTSSLRPVVNVSYTDDTGVDTASTRLLLYRQGAQPATVAAALTQTALTYQPPADLEEGVYTVEAVVTNNLGSSTRIGPFNFTLDADAPVIDAVEPASVTQHGGVPVKINGSRLFSRLTPAPLAPSVLFGGRPARVVAFSAGATDELTVLPPAGAPGQTSVEVRTDGGRGLRGDLFSYEPDPRTPLVSEQDTILLWHLDEEGDGSQTVIDAGPSHSLYGRTSANSASSPGRFGGARARAATVANADYRAFGFDHTSFTVECWMKTAPVGRAYTLVGKEDGDGFFSFGTEYALRLLPTGGLRALVKDSGNRDWLVEMGPNVLDVDDDRWHQLAMVLDRAAGRLSIYVDGEERAFGATPPDFGPNLTNNQLLRVGKWALYDGNVSGGPYEFPGTIDDVRVSSNAHTPEAIRNTYLGTEGALGVRITNNSVVSLPRGATTDVTVGGYNLAGGRAALRGSGAETPALVLNSSATQASVRVLVGTDAPLGDARLVLFSAAGSAELPVRVIDLERVALAPEPDTRLLWHLDESVGAAVRVSDASIFSIDGTSGAASSAQPGRFGGGRASANVVADTDYGSLSFGAGSFTVECWFKTDPVGRAYTLVGKEDGDGFFSFGTEYALRLLPTGGMRAIVRDSSNREWRADMFPTVYDVDDGQWHHAALVVDRSSERLSLYVDGVERAFAPRPAVFDNVLSNNQPLRVGKRALYDGDVTGGPYEFPGVIEDVRVSSTAHSAQRVLNNVTGGTPLNVTSYNPKEVFRQSLGAQPSTNRLVIDGYNLDGATARLERDGRPVQATINVESSSPRRATLNVNVATGAPLGTAQLVLSKAGQPDFSVNVRVAESAELPGDSDTVLLWHLNETANGGTRVDDEGSLSIDGTASPLSSAQPGRFGGGRASANVVADTDYGALSFGAGSFTVECWLKTAPVGRAYTLVGKEDGDGFFSFGTEYALRLLTTGGLRAVVRDSSNREWVTEVGPTVSHVDDGQWHHAALVVDRSADKLSIVIDGEERASSPRPAAFDTVLSNNQLLRVGKWALYDGNVSGGPYEFPGTIDDVRISSNAHAPERIRRDVDADTNIRINASEPREVLIAGPGGEPYVTQINVEGYHLDGVTARVLRDGQPLAASVNVVSSSYRNARLTVALAAGTTPGPAQLVLAREGRSETSVDLRVTEQNELPVDNDTVVLWHLNEAANGGTRVLDEGRLSINGTAGAASSAQPGHFGGGRASANVVADTDYGSLSFGGGSFTVECWFKTDPVGRAYTLVGKEDGDGFFSFGTEYALRLLPAAGLRAVVRDSSNREWRADMPGRVYDASQGRWRTLLDNGQWHHAAMVVDRSSDRLLLYVDGVERASVSRPAAFDTVLSNNQLLRVGKRALYDGDVSGGPYEFPGVIDDVRVSSTAHNADKIASDVFGVIPARLSYAVPNVVPTGAVSLPIVLRGYGLAGATATTNRDDVTVNVVSTTPTQMNLSVTVSPTASLGEARLFVQDASGRLISSDQPFRGSDTALNIVRQQSFVNADAGAETPLLWHLDEASNGSVRVVGTGDAVPSVIGGQAGALSTAQPGRFGGGRANANVIADTSGALSFGAGSFTVECWMKTAPVGRAYTLVGKEDGDGFFSFGTEYALRLLPAAGLRAVVRDSSNREWRADMPGRVYDANRGRWTTMLDDGQWHHIAMVVDRDSDSLLIYVDGVEHASSQRPAAFDTVLSNNQLLRVGKRALYDGDVSGGPYEFPGVIDEVRIVNFARTAKQIEFTWLGENPVFDFE